MLDHLNGGTTLAISKLGSGLASVLDPCIEKFLDEEEYYDLCVEYNVVDQCYLNKFFPDDESQSTPPYLLPTNELATRCESGYCACPGTEHIPTSPPTHAPIHEPLPDSEDLVMMPSEEETTSPENLEVVPSTEKMLPNSEDGI